MEGNGRKRPAAIAALLALACGLAFLWAAGRRPAENRIVKIGVCAYKTSDTFIASILSALEGIAKEAEKSQEVTIKLDISDGRNSQEVQNEQVERYISLGYDVICLNIVDRTSAANLVDKAADAGVALIFFNREPVEEDILRSQEVYYIGSDAKKSAILQGEMILSAYRANAGSIDKNADGVIRYVMIEGEAGHQDTVIRSEYAVKTLEEGGLKLDKVAGFSADFERSQASVLLEQWLLSTEEVPELIISNNDDMALGAADAMEKLRQERVAIVGIDGIPAGIQAVEDGRLLGTVVSDAALYADKIFTLASSLGRGEGAPESIGLEQGRYVWIPWRTHTSEEFSW